VNEAWKNGNKEFLKDIANMKGCSYVRFFEELKAGSNKSNIEIEEIKKVSVTFTIAKNKNSDVLH